MPNAAILSIIGVRSRRPNSPSDTRLWIQICCLRPYEWTSVGFNFYIRQHNLKIQTDYTFRQGDSGTLFTIMQEDVFEVQLQLDF